MSDAPVGLRVTHFGAAQAVTGRVTYNAEQLDHHEAALSLLQYVGTSDFWDRTLQNWQSEFLAVGSMAVLHSYGAALDLVAGGAIDTKALLTDTVALEKFPEALDLMRSGAGLKVQVVPGVSSDRIERRQPR